MKRIEPLGLPLICGIWPLVSYRNAEFMNNEVPGARVPPDILERMRRTTTQDEGFREGVAIAKETYERLKNSVAGIQLSAPWGASKESSRSWNRRSAYFLGRDRQIRTSGPPPRDRRE